MAEWPIAARLLAVVFMFSAATVWLWALVSYATPASSESSSLTFPGNLDQLKRLARTLNQYAEIEPFYVLVLFGSAYLFKQTFAIPGSVFMNLLAGAIYGTWLGFPLCCLLTATGATFCFLLSKLAGSRLLLERYWPDKLDQLRSRIQQTDDSELLWLLISLRLFPMTPNWFLNIAAPVIPIPISLFFLSVLIGLMPYNFICVQTGSMLSQLTSLDDVFTVRTMAGLIAIAIVFVTPMLIKKWLRKTAAKPKSN